MMSIFIAIAAVAAWPERHPQQRLPEVWATAEKTRRAGRGQAESVTKKRWDEMWKWLIVPIGIGSVWLGFAAAISGVAVGWTALTLYRSARAGHAMREREEHMEKALDGVVAELRAGSSGDMALRDAGSTGDDVINSPAWKLAQRFGLPLADILDKARIDIAARRAHRARTAAALAGPRMTMVILAALPLFGLVLGQGFGASPLRFLLGHTFGGIGGIVLVTGTFLTCAGLVWSNTILAAAEGQQ